MKLFICLLLLVISSCTPYEERTNIKEEHNFYFEEADSVVFLGDTALIEYQNIGSKVINHYVKLDSIGNSTFRSFSVSIFNKISPSKSKIEYLNNNIKFDNYKITYGLDSIKNWRDAIRDGNFNCYKNDSIISNVIIVEKITEGNGTYRNTLLMIDLEEQDTIVFFNHFDPWLVKSYSWEWKNLKPKTWKEYQEEILEYKKIGETLESVEFQ